MKYFGDDQVEAARKAYPDHAIVEVISTHNWLLAIPLTHPKRSAPIPSMPDWTVELLDGASISF